MSVSYRGLKLVLCIQELGLSGYIPLLVSLEPSPLSLCVCMCVKILSILQKKKKKNFFTYQLLLTIVLVCKKICKISCDSSIFYKLKHYFCPYILGSQSI